MLMKADNCTARHIAHTLHHASSTITRDINRFGLWPDLLPANSAATYDALAAGLRARRDGVKWACSLHWFVSFWVFAFLPDVIALTLTSIDHNGYRLRLSYEITYNCVYPQFVVATLYHALTKLVPRSKGQISRGQISYSLGIKLRPRMIENHRLSGCWKRVLIGYPQRQRGRNAGCGHQPRDLYLQRSKYEGARASDTTRARNYKY